MEPAFTVTPATTSDIPLIRELTFKVWPQTYANILSTEQIDYMLDLMYSENSLHKQMNEGSQFLVIHNNNEPAGFASYQEIKPTIFKLHKIYVLQSQQGIGTGKYLLNHILTEIKNKGGSTLQLQVNRHNQAKVFYEKLGFTVIDFINLDIGNGFFMNDFVMEKKLQ